MKHNQNMIAAIYHQLGVWINYFYGHSWLFRQSLKYISMLRVTWTEHKTNEEVLKMANTTRSLLPMIKKIKCQYFERGRSGQTSGPVASVKDLGITLDSYLNFNDNVYTFTSSLLSMLCQIGRVRHLFTKPVLSTILNSLIFSKRFYCSTVWAGTAKQNLQKLQLVQNFAARVLTDTEKFDHISPVLRELGWPSIKDQLLVRDTTQVYKIVSSVAPFYLSSKLSKRPDPHNYNTRKRNSLNIPLYRTVTAHRSLFLLSCCKCLELSDRRH